MQIFSNFLKMKEEMRENEVVELKLVFYSRKLFRAFFFAELACSPCVHLGLLWALRFPPTDQKHVSWGWVDW